MSRRLKLNTFLVRLPLIFVFLNCSPSHIVGSLNQSSNTNDSGILGGALESTSVAIYEKTVFPILRTNCASCHGVSQAPMHSVADVNQSHTTVLSYSLVDLTTPSSSRLVVKINSGHKSIPTTVGTSLLAAITDWSNQLTAAGGGLPNVPVIALEPTYSSISKLILEPKCVACHGPSIAKEGVRYDTYANTLQTVKPGNPMGSDLYYSVLMGEMPLKAPNLTSEELGVISEWITNGAPNN